MHQWLSPPLHLPRARVESIASSSDALSVVALAISRPLREELVVITCDCQRRGLSLTVFPCMTTPLILAHDVIGCVSAVPEAVGVIATHVAPSDHSVRFTLHQCLTRAGLRLEHFFTISNGEVSLLD